MQQVKTFFHAQVPKLATDLEKWIDQVNGQVQLVGIDLDSNQFGHCLSILYTQTPGPYYWTQVHFHTRHDNLERLANEGLQSVSAGHARFLAQGSNDYGHCLCVIGERA